MDTPMPEATIDPVWWAEKVRVIARDWCPECEPGVDPIRDLVVLQRCNAHWLAVKGTEDARVPPRSFESYVL